MIYKNTYGLYHTVILTSTGISKQILLMHKTCIYWYFKKAILHNTVYQKKFFLKKPFQTGSVVHSGLDCTNIFRPMPRWHSAQWAILGLESCPKVISLEVKFSVFKDQNFIPKARPPREEWLDLLQNREKEKGIKMLSKWP